MKLKKIENKEDYLKRHYPFGDIPKLNDKKHCLHCGNDFLVGDYKVQTEYNYFTGKEENYIVCPNAPECDGTVIEWIDSREK